MKKLMIVAAVAISAVVANAAQTKWGFTDEYEGDDGADLSGYTAYLISSANWDTTDVGGSLAKAIAVAPYADWSDDSDGNGYYAYSFNDNAVTGLSEDLVGQGQDYYIVFADASHYAASAVTGDIIAAGDNTQPTAFLDDTFSLAASDLTSYGTPEPPPGPGPDDPSGGVPEPTSGLLLLVGLAGMALKRKIA